MTTFAVLGPLTVITADGRDVTPPGDLPRRLLAMLLLRRGRVVPVDRLIEAVWPAGPAPGAAALHSHVSRLRKRIPDLALEFTGGGYRLEVEADALDAGRFEAAVSHAASIVDHEPADALDELDEALGRWRGRPYADLVDDDDGVIEIERLEEIRLRAVEERLATLLALGRPRDALADLDALVAREPLRERPRRLLMDALSACGRRADALRVYDEYRLALSAELGVSPSPGIRARHDELLALDDVTVVPDRPAAPALPLRPISKLFGRDRDLDALIERVPAARIVTLIGPGGVGKTRLAVETAHRIGSASGDTIAFCDLTRVPEGADVDAVGAALCATLRVEPRSPVSPAERITEVYRTEELLLVLDNCEHVLDGAAALVERVVGATERVRVLATSRERLAVDGELLWPVTPLPCDRDGGLTAARELFSDRARAVGATEELDADAVGDLCCRLDGLPLAIELAASRLRSLSLGEITAGLSESMTVLAGGRRTVSRHQSLDAAIDWSYRLLPDDVRRTLGAGAVFAAPFEVVDAAGVLGAEHAAARERLAALAERSLVVRAGERYRLLETIRSFVRERTPPDERDRLLEAHARHVATRITQASDALRHAADDRPIAFARHVAADLGQALDTAISLRDADLALGLVVACRDLALDGMMPELMTAGERLGALGDVEDPRIVDAFAIAAFGAWKVSDFTAMHALLERAAGHARRLGVDRRYELAGTAGLAAVARGDLTAAVEHAASALLDPEIGDDLHRLAEGRATLAIFRSYAHDPLAGQDVATLLADVEPRAGAVPRAWCWYAAGECALDRDPARARACLERAVAEARAGGATFVEGIAATSLASLAVRERRLDDAVVIYRRLLPHWLRAGVAAPFWTMSRSVTDLLAQHGADADAARLLGAVTHPGTGHALAGDDDVRLAHVEQTLRARLGASRLDELAAAGAELDEAAVAALATAAFDRLS